MGKVKMLALAGATALVNTAAFAADLPFKAPYQPLLVDTGGWYLRGDIGVGAQSFKNFDFTQTNAGVGGAWPASWRIDQKDIKDTVLVGGGIGYQWNSWLRMDLTGEYRTDVKFKAVGSYIHGNPLAPPGDRAFDVYDGDHSAFVALANAYIDLGTWWCLTPFIGAGVGGAYHRTAALTDLGVNTNGFGASSLGFANSSQNTWSFAWAAHAGLAYSVTSNVKLELAYRYLSMGNAKTSEVNCGSGGCNVVGGGPRAFYTLTDFTSHDIKIGMRWLLQPAEPAPLMRRG
jgi:opacity protein-like surface antigen